MQILSGLMLLVGRFVPLGLTILGRSFQYLGVPHFDGAGRISTGPRRDSALGFLGLALSRKIRRNFASLKLRRQGEADRFVRGAMIRPEILASNVNERAANGTLAISVTPGALISRIEPRNPPLFFAFLSSTLESLRGRFASRVLRPRHVFRPAQNIKRAVRKYVTADFRANIDCSGNVTLRIHFQNALLYHWLR